MRTSSNIINNPKLYRLFATGLFSFLVAYVAASVLMPVESSSATDISDTKSQNMSVTVNYNPIEYYLNVSSAHSTTGEAVSLDYSSSETNLGNVLAASDTVSMKTNSPLNRYLYLSTNSNSNALSGTDESLSGSSISAGGGDTLAGASVLSDNTWGFALPSGTSGIPENSFDASYAAESLSNNSTFAKVPTLNNEVLIQQASGSGDEEDTTETTSTADVYYGVKGTSSLLSGTYSNTIKYTAYAEAPDQLYPYPDTIDLSDSSTSRDVLIYTAIATTSETIASETATVEFYSGTSGSETIIGTCTNPTLALTNNNFITISCTAPEIYTLGTYGIRITFTNLARVVAVDSLIAYTAATITSCSQLSTNEIGILDGYVVRKLADGKCWQASNYKSGVTWENASCPSGFILPTREVSTSLVEAIAHSGQLYSFGWSGIYWSSSEYQYNNDIVFIMTAEADLSRTNLFWKTSLGNVRCYAQ